MELMEFLNLYKIVTSLDHSELKFLDSWEWTKFSSSPMNYLLRADDETAYKIWQVIKGRAFQLRAENSYIDESYVERKCDRCGKSYKGPAVYCSLICATADA